MANLFWPSDEEDDLMDDELIENLDALENSSRHKVASQTAWVSPSFDSSSFDSTPSQQRRRPSIESRQLKSTSISNSQAIIIDDDDHRRVQPLKPPPALRHLSTLSTTIIGSQRGKCGAQSSSANTRNKKLRSTTSISEKGDDVNTSWAQKYTPQSKDQLCIHKKKISDVETWIQKSLNTGHILLVDGGSGTGKSTTVKVLCRHLGIEVRHWSAESNRTKDLQSEEYSESQSDQFLRFIGKSNKYPNLCFTDNDGNGEGGGVNSNYLVLIDDFPTTIARKPELLHDYLREKKSLCPMVFVLSGAGTDALAHKLFPADLRRCLAVQCITFNAISQTALVKTLTNIVNLESNKVNSNIERLSKETIDNIATLSNGDLRNAINQLNFSSMKCKVRIKKSDIKKGDSNKKKNVQSKQTNYFIFRALGKILHSKREVDKDAKKTKNLPTKRTPLQFIPEEVIDRCHLSPDLFTGYLHQNYVAYYGADIASVATSAADLSVADCVASIEWNKPRSNQISASISSRSIAYHAFSAERSKPRWCPLHKPMSFGVQQSANANLRNAQSLFSELTSDSSDLLMNIIPYCKYLSPTNFSQAQLSLSCSLNKYSRNTYLRKEKLDENECVNESAKEIDLTPNIQQYQPIKSQETSNYIDDEVVIDDFD